MDRCAERSCSHEQWSQTAVIYFGKDHKFALIHCTVYRVSKKHMTISNGDPRGVYTGEWNIYDDSVTLTYQLVDQTIVRQKLPGPVQHASIKIFAGPTLEFGGNQFRREKALDESAARALSETIRLPAQDKH